MEQYKLSQNPGGSSKKKRPKKSRAPKRASTQSLSPVLIIGIIAAVVILLGGSVLAMHFYSSRTKSTGASKAGSSKTTASTKGQVPPKTFNDITKAISDKNFNGLKGYYAKQVKVVIPRKSVNVVVKGGLVGNYITDPLNLAQNPWVWHVPAEDLAAWQQGPYGQYFTGNVMVGISNDGTVISIGFNDQGEIVTIFVAPVGDLTNPTPPAGSGSGTDTTPSPGGTDTTPGSPPVPTSENAND